MPDPYDDPPSGEEVVQEALDLEDSAFRDNRDEIPIDGLEAEESVLQQQHFPDICRELASETPFIPYAEQPRTIPVSLRGLDQEGAKLVATGVQKRKIVDKDDQVPLEEDGKPPAKKKGRRGSYKCGKCGARKAGHLCPHEFVRLKTPKDQHEVKQTQTPTPADAESGSWDTGETRTVSPSAGSPNVTETILDIKILAWLLVQVCQRFLQNADSGGSNIDTVGRLLAAASSGIGNEGASIDEMADGKPASLQNEVSSTS